MIYFHWLILLVYLVIVLGAMVAVLLDNRQPAKTMAWLLVLVFIPVIGVILYFFFGQNTRKEKIISSQSLDQLTKRSILSFVDQRDLKLPEDYRTLIRLFSNEGLALPYKNNRVNILTDGYDYVFALLAAIGRARHHIHLGVYIFADDPLGYLVADALIDKSQQGVEVRVIYDDVGCWNVPSSFFERMRDAGIDVHAFMPVKFPAFTSKINYRNHRKLCIIDGCEGFIGGMNIAQRYVSGRKGEGWRDTHLHIEGAAVYGLQSAFLIDWYFVDRTLISDRVYYPEVKQQLYNNCIAQVVTSNPTSRWPEIEQGYVRIILEAKQYVYMETPYFLPTEPVLSAMHTAALGGIDVRLMLPIHTDTKLAEWAGRSYVKEAIEAGVKVYYYKGRFNHSKLLVCDDFLCSCGSTNIDFRSFNNNFEANVFFYEEGMAIRMKSIFLRDMECCDLVDDVETFSNRPFFNRLWESFVRLFSPLL